MILTEDECFAALADDITEIEETRACEEEWTVIVAMCRAFEAAVLTKLAQGVDMPEPISYVSFNRQGDISRIIKRKDSWTNTPVFTADQLRTCIAAARVKALEDAALNCEELHWTWRMGDNSGPTECAEKIRALKGGAA